MREASSEPNSPPPGAARLLVAERPEHGGTLLLSVVDAHGRPRDLLVELPGRLVWVLLALHQARCDDAARRIPAAVAGWRRPEKVALWIARHTGWELEAQTVRAYMTLVHRELRGVARRELIDHVPEVIERRRGRGARLFTGGLELIGSPPTSTHQAGPSEC
jgi:hypothetical protein